MNTVSRSITGTLVAVLGIAFIVMAVIWDIWLLAYGIPFLAVGGYIFFNKKEDDIEGIKSKKDNTKE
ncbi:hypothetical protein ACFL2D_01650 [Patescibacteria group bacterium]